MKKQFLLLGLMIVAGICLCTDNQNSLSACVKEADACPVKIKKEIKINTAGYVEDEDASFNMFMNPLNQL